MQKSPRRRIGQMLKKARLDNGFSQGEIASRLGYSSPQFISNIERGLCDPPLKTLKRLVAMYRLKTEIVHGLLIEGRDLEIRTALGMQIK